ncbi:MULTISPECIES: hypothetical protein [Enterobacterales]|uniref:leucine-rich repeat domain-containing protein n=1 Tax=Enterobacterales TaxID=91347 RepID=UPI002EDA23CF
MINTNISNTVVDIPDTNLNIVLHNTLGIAVDVPLTSDDLAMVTLLDASNASIVDLTGMQYCINLSIADFSHNSINSLAPLSNLVTITELDISNNVISDITTLASLSNLITLTMVAVNTQATEPDHLDLSVLNNFKNIKALDISNNQITKANIIGQLISLKTLKAEEFAIDTNESQFLANLVNLKSLITSDGKYTSIDFLSTMIAIEYIALSRCSMFHDVTPLKDLQKLNYLAITQNSLIYNITPITENPSIKVLHFVDSIINPSPITNMVNLTELQVNNCGLSNLDFISGCSSLISLDANTSTISDISPLKALTHLEILTMQYSNVSDISAVTDMPALTSLNILNGLITTARPVLNNPNITSLNLGFNFLTSPDEYDLLKLRFENDAFLSYNYIYGRLEQFAFYYNAPSIVLNIGETITKTFVEYLTLDGIVYSPSGIQKLSLNYCNVISNDENIAKILSVNIDPNTSSINIDLSGVSVGNTVLEIVGSNNSTLLPFTSGEYSIPVSVN